METRYVAEFLKLAEVHNYSKAADELYVSQSSLTKHIKTLEADLGHTLFDRTTRRIELSSFGELFLPYAQNIVNVESEFSKSCIDLMMQDETTLRLGVLHAFLDYGMYHLLGEYTDRYPSYHYTLTEADTPDLFKGLKENLFEVAFIRHAGSITDTDIFEFIPVLSDPVAVLVPHGHPLDRSDRAVPVELLAGYNLISSCSREEMTMLADAAAKRGAVLTFASRIHRNQSILHMLELGEGPALMLERLAKSMFGDQLAAIPVSPEINTCVSLVYKKNRRLSSAAGSFINYVKNQMQPEP